MHFYYGAISQAKFNTIPSLKSAIIYTPIGARYGSGGYNNPYRYIAKYPVDNPNGLVGQKTSSFDSTGDFYIYVNNTSTIYDPYVQPVVTPDNLSDVFDNEYESKILIGKRKFKSTIDKLPTAYLTKELVDSLKLFSLEDRYEQGIPFSINVGGYYAIRFGATSEAYTEDSVTFTYADLYKANPSYGDWTYRITLENISDLADRTWDFGSGGVEVPNYFYDWILDVTNEVLDIDITIKRNDVTLSTINSTNKLTSYMLNLVNNQISVKFYDENGTSYNSSWTANIPDGLSFLGLSSKLTSTIPEYPIGSGDILINNDIILYEIFGVPKTPPTLFKIDLYQNTAEYNRVDKTNYLTTVGTLNGVMRDSSSIIDLTITIESADIPNFNYVYIEKFGRYYFVNDIRIVRNNLFEIDMTVDVLMSYKDAIKGLRAFVDRNENTQNPMLIDKKKVIEQGIDIEDNNVPNTIEFGFNEYEPTPGVRFVLNGYKLSIEYVEV